MHEQKDQKRIQDAMNRSLSGLREDPALIQRVIENEKGGKRVMKRKISVGLAVTVTVVLVVLSAFAVGLVFSPRYTVKRLADQALHEQYGITDEMMTVLYRSEGETEPGGSQVFTYASVEALYAEQIGVYTVTVKDGKAKAVWSHDGEDTSGGTQASAWGAEQLAVLCSDQFDEVCAQLAPTAVPLSSEEPIVFDEVAAAEAETMFLEQQNEWERNRKQVLAAAKITLEDVQNLAISAISSEYSLTSAQCGQLAFHDELYGATFRFAEGRPIVEMYFHLTQQEDGSFVEKDGIYVVTVYMDNGVIDDMIYDSGLAANR